MTPDGPAALLHLILLSALWIGVADTLEGGPAVGGTSGSSLLGHTNSTLSSLAYCSTHEFRTGVPWEILYADDLMLIADTQEECISKLKAWKAE